MNRAATLLPALLCAHSLFAQPKWISMENENFRVFSSASERDTRDALNQFERVRGFFIQFTGAAPAKPVPISVVIFGSEKEYLPYRFNEFAIAYYTGQSDRDFIVVGKLGEQSSQIATHEYTHLVLRHAGFRLPPWLNEGIADLFSTLGPLAGNTEFGNVMLGRLQALSREPWVPMQTILAAGSDSPYYNESNKAGSLYNQSWALVHMLATRNEYRFKFWDMVQAIQDGAPSVQALEKTYGIPFPRLENELRAYIHGNSFNKLVVNLKLDATDKLKGQPADLSDVRTVQAELLMGLSGKQAEARTRLEELTREDAKRPEPWANLGYLVWRDGKSADAVAHFSRAIELGNRSPRLLLDFSRLALRDRPEEAARALTALLELEPTNLDARLDLANLYLSQRHYAEALTVAGSVSAVKTADQRDRLLYVRAFSAMQMGDLTEARARAEELKRLTTAQAYGLRADDMLRFLDQSEAQRQRLAQAVPAPEFVATPVAQVEADPPAAEDTERPTLVQRESPPATRADMEIILQDVQGTLVELNCQSPPRFILETPAGRKTFLVLQPDRLIVTGRVGGAQFDCGPQKPAPAMRLQFTIAPEGSTADGVVRAVHF